MDPRRLLEELLASESPPKLLQWAVVAVLGLW